MQSQIQTDPAPSRTSRWPYGGWGDWEDWGMDWSDHGECRHTQGTVSPTRMYAIMDQAASWDTKSGFLSVRSPANRPHPFTVTRMLSVPSVGVPHMKRGVKWMWPRLGCPIVSLPCSQSPGPRAEGGGNSSAWHLGTTVHHQPSFLVHCCPPRMTFVH